MDGLAAAAGVLPAFVIVGLVVWFTTRRANAAAAGAEDDSSRPG